MCQRIVGHTRLFGDILRLLTIEAFFLGLLTSNHTYSVIFIHYLITWTGSRADRLSVTCLLHLLGSRASPDGLLVLSLQCICAVFRETDADVAIQHICAGHDNVPGWLDAAMLLSLSCKLGAGNPSQASKAKQLGVSFACAITEKSLVEARYSSLAHVLQHAP